MKKKRHIYTVILLTFLFNGMNLHAGSGDVDAVVNNKTITVTGVVYGDNISLGAGLGIGEGFNNDHVCLSPNCSSDYWGIGNSESCADRQTRTEATAVYNKCPGQYTVGVGRMFYQINPFYCYGNLLYATKNVEITCGFDNFSINVNTTEWVSAVNTL
jgi:hypothetical protein